MAWPRINTGYARRWDFPPAQHFLRAQAFLLFINSSFLFPNISSHYIMKGVDSPLSGMISPLYHLQIKPMKIGEEITNWTAHLVTVELKVPNKPRGRAFSWGQLTCGLREKAGLGGSEEVKQEAASHPCPRLCIRISTSCKEEEDEVLKTSFLTGSTHKLCLLILKFLKYIK